MKETTVNVAVLRTSVGFPIPDPNVILPTFEVTAKHVELMRHARVRIADRSETCICYAVAANDRYDKPVTDLCDWVSAQIDRDTMYSSWLVNKFGFIAEDHSADWKVKLRQARLEWMTVMTMVLSRLLTESPIKWMLAEYTSSHSPSKKVLCLSQGVERIAADRKHHSFVREVLTSDEVDRDREGVREYNRAIDFAIGLGLEAANFLTCWREGDWDACREFGYESLLNPDPTAQVKED